MQKKGGAGHLRNATWKCYVGTQRLRFCTHLRTPLIKSMLDAVYDVGQEHTGDREDQHADEDLIGLEGRACDGDHKANARRCRIELAHHDTDKRPA